MNEEPRFLADAMLGRLARWLRVLGLDTLYDEVNPDPVLVQTADEEDRVLLTRDRHLLRELRPVRAWEVTEDAPLAQLRDVVRRFDIGFPRELFTRCLVCNTPLVELGESEALALVPDRSRGLPGPVRRCPACGRVYWQGSHARRMRAALERSLGNGLETRGDECT